MGILDDIRNVFRTKSKGIKQAPLTVYNNVGYSTVKKDKYQDFADEGYQDNAVVYKCVN